MYKVRGGLCNVDSRRPYGELQSVDKANCFCCIGVASALLQSGPVCPGMGCDNDYVNEIVTEMKKRMKERGDTAQLLRTEEALVEIKELRSEVSNIRSDLGAIMKALNVTPTSTSPTFEMTMDRM